MIGELHPICAHSFRLAHPTPDHACSLLCWTTLSNCALTFTSSSGERSQILLTACTSPRLESGVQFTLETLPARLPVNLSSHTFTFTADSPSTCNQVTRPCMHTPHSPIHAYSPQSYSQLKLSVLSLYPFNTVG